MSAITPLYAALATLFYLSLSARVIALRRSARISLGTKGPAALEPLVRAQGNCAEYAPLGLLLMLMVELQGLPPIGVHLLGIMLLVGRIAHARGLSTTPQNLTLRTVGMVLTLTMLLAGAVVAAGLAVVG